MELLDIEQTLPSSPRLLQFDLFGGVERREVAEAIKHLPAQERLALALLYVEELTLIEAALVLDMTVSDVLAAHSSATVLIQAILARQSD